MSESFDAAGISAGKFCESVLRLLQHELTGQSTPFGKHIPNFPDSCRKLIVLEAGAGPESRSSSSTRCAAREELGT